MALQGSGQISLSDIRNELVDTGEISLGSVKSRSLAGVQTGTISLESFYGDSSSWIRTYVDLDGGDYNGTKQQLLGNSIHYRNHEIIVPFYDYRGQNFGNGSIYTKIYRIGLNGTTIGSTKTWSGAIRLNSATNGTTDQNVTYAWQPDSSAYPYYHGQLDPTTFAVVWGKSISPPATEPQDNIWLPTLNSTNTVSGGVYLATVGGTNAGAAGIIKYNSSGVRQWFKGFTRDGTINGWPNSWESWSPTGIKTDLSDNPYLMTRSSKSQENNYGRGVELHKFGADGSFLWSKYWFVQSVSSGYTTSSFAINPNGNVLVSFNLLQGGYTSTTNYFRLLNSSGAEILSRSLTANFYTSPTVISDPTTNFFYVYYELDENPRYLTILKIDESGTIQWARKIKNLGADAGATFYEPIVSHGNIIIKGYASVTIDEYTSAQSVFLVTVPDDGSRTIVTTSFEDYQSAYVSTFDYSSTTVTLGTSTITTYTGFIIATFNRTDISETSSSLYTETAGVAPHSTAPDFTTSILNL